MITKRITKNRKEVKPGNTKTFIVLHHTGSSRDTLGSILRYFQISDYLSIHYIVGKDGQIIQYADDNDIAYHCGQSQWGKLKDMNQYSIGIEVVSDGYEFTDKQREAVVWLCRQLMEKYNIPYENLIRHADIAPDRKWDIGYNFFAKWNNWQGFQRYVGETKDYQTELAEAEKWIKAEQISNGEEPDRGITRGEVFVMLHRLKKRFDLQK